MLIFLTILRRTAGALVCGLVATELAHAQDTAFLAVVQKLATGAGESAAAQVQLKSALAEWDRQIGALAEAQSPSGAQAFERHLALGLAYRRRGRLDDALRQFDAAAALRPEASDIQLLRGQTLQMWGPPSGGPNRSPEAGQAFYAAWQRDADNPIKAYLALRLGDLDAADRARGMDVLRQAFSQVITGAHRPTATPFLTLDLIPDTLARTPIVGTGVMAGVFAHLAAGRLDQAVAALDRPRAPPAPSGVEGPAPSGVEGPAPSGVEGALDRARAAEADGRLDDAAREYTTALTGTLAGRHALYVGIGRLSQVRGEYDAAIAAFSQAARLSPNDPVIRRELAAAFVAAGRADDAFAELVAALLLAPENAEALAAVGQLYLDTDRPAEAIPVLRRVLAIQANRYETHYALATAFSRVGLTDDAAREFQRFDRLSREALAARRRSVAGEAGPPAREPQ